MDFNLMTNDKGATVYAFTLRMRATGTLEWPLTQVQKAFAMDCKTCIIGVNIWKNNVLLIFLMSILSLPAPAQPPPDQVTNGKV